MALFDLTPKDSPEELFGREQELAQLVRLVSAGRWVAVLGPRMVGKTSLVRAAAKRVNRQTVYVSLWGATGARGFVEAIAHGINANRTLLGRIRARVRSIEGLSIGHAGLSVVAPRLPLRTMWDLLDHIAIEAEDTVFELDEFQEVSSASGPVLRILANIFNTHHKVGFVFTGSRTGVIRALLDPKPTSPLFGRPPAQLVLKPFPPETSLEFLVRGLKESRVEAPRDQLESVIRRSLDGLPGWLTLYGNHLAFARESPDRAEQLTVMEGHKVAREQIHHFLEGRSRENYWAALKALAEGASWSEISSGISRRRGAAVNDNTIRGILRSLDEASLTEHEGSTYRLSDPMIRSFVRGAHRVP